MGAYGHLVIVVEVANVQYFEGGSLIPNKSPGRLTFSDVTLERGATQDRDLFDWFQDVAITSSGLGLTDVNYKRNLDAASVHGQQDRDGLTLRRWSLSRAWPVTFVAGERNNESDENIIESVTLTYDYFEPVAVSREADRAIPQTASGLSKPLRRVADRTLTAAYTSNMRYLLRRLRP